MKDFENIRNIAYLGPENSFSEMVTDEYSSMYNLNCYPMPFNTIKQVVDYVSKNTEDTIGVLPVENTIDGAIRESIDSIILSTNPNLKIISEMIMPVEYCLLSKTTEFYSITGLIATPRLLGKCGKFIEEEMPRNLNIIESATMLESARELNNHNLTYACIGNRKIAQNCMLNILKENIHDDKYNRTRYILIGDIETKPTKKDKTTIAFRTNNTPGALLDILKIFLEHNINLTHISSYASRTKMDEYIFVVNLDGHIQNTAILKAINKMRPRISFLRFLGSYKSAQ